MSAHASVQDLSAYLDRCLDEPATRRVERHLDLCGDCRERFQGMRRVAEGLRGLGDVEPPAELEQAVARRIRLAGEQEPWLDRLENGLGTFQKQSSTLAIFAVVLALAVMLVLFAQALERARNETIPVYFDDPPAREAPAQEAPP